MISEPEMEGELDAAASHDVVSDRDQRAAGHLRSRRPWAWALGGAAAASAFWAASVLVFGLGQQEPDIGGYRLTKDSCRAVRLVSLAAAIAPRSSGDLTDSGLLKHSALDQVQCSIHLRDEVAEDGPGSGWSIDYTVGISVALHKKTDPGTEFEALRRVSDLGVVPEANVKSAPYVGEKAYLITRDLGNTELRVLEGGAVLVLKLSAVPSYLDDGSGEEAGDGPDSPDLSAYQPAMVNDMRDLMSDLKQ
ncbi:hypothetical protein [Streptomyces siamensis]|uniref:Uncharacterized protein n=1 Tax=Streptomyces siamensis TaxID=1274986 RepID=A0ABP9J857_9ACTN